MAINPSIAYAICFTIFALVLQRIISARQPLRAGCESAPHYPGRVSWDVLNILFLRDMLKASKQGTLHTFEHVLFEKLSSGTHTPMRTFRYTRPGLPTLSTKDRANVHAVLTTQFADFTAAGRAKSFIPLLTKHTMVRATFNMKEPNLELTLETTDCT